MNPMSGAGASGYGSQGTTSIFISLAVVALVLVLRNRRPRPLRIDRLWLRPIISIAFVIAFFVTIPPKLNVTTVVAMLVGLLAGGAFGWQRGRFMRIEVDPVTHAVTARLSQVGTIFVLIFIGLRYWLRGAVVGPAAFAVTDGLVVSAVAMMLAQQTEISLRARRLLGEARAASGSPG